MKQLPIPAPRPTTPNPNIVALLERAKGLLWGGTDVYDMIAGPTQYICHAIIDAAGDDGEDKPDVSDALAHIADCLFDEDVGGCTAYVGWLYNQDVVIDDYTDVQIQIQAARQRWIDQLIQDFGGPRQTAEKP